jgi:predicted Fe-Mo cluster-binding NifX family protein
MQIAISASENHVKSHVAPYFGRCDWFCLFDTETRKSEFIENTARHQLKKAGCDAVDFLVEKGINIAIAGRFGSKVVEAFRAKNVQIIIPEKEKTIQEIINQIK